MPLEKLSPNDRLGENSSHFFKSGNVLRNPECLSLKLAKLLPPKGLYKTNLEYDLWYDMGGKDRIHGYVYTDALSDYLYIRPANSYFADSAMYASLKLPPSSYGQKLVDEMGAGIPDKYRLRKATTKHKFVIFLPGTNCIDDTLDWDKAKRAVGQGAVLKPHPLTSASLMLRLQHFFGAGNVLSKKESGHQLLHDAEIVGCCVNSEMGIAAIAADKGFHLFTDIRLPRSFTYSSIYRVILGGGNYRENLVKILGSPFSGMIHGNRDDALDCIAAFFNQFSEVPHVEPKNSST